MARAAAFPSGSPPGRMESGVVDKPDATKPRLPTLAEVCAVPATTPASLMSFPHIASQHPIRPWAPVDEDQRKALGSSACGVTHPEPVTWPALFRPMAAPVAWNSPTGAVGKICVP